MGWSGLTLVTDADIGAIEPEATRSSRPWGAATWPKPRAEAKRDLKIWLERDFANRVPLQSVADRVLDTWALEKVLGYTNLAYTDLTLQASDDHEEDLDLSVVLATTPTPDALLCGARWEFDGLYFQIASDASRNLLNALLSVEYWGGGGWTVLTATDGTTFSLESTSVFRSGRLRWTPPIDWIPTRLNQADEYFWVRLTVPSPLSVGKLSQLLAIRSPDGLKLVAGYLALAHIFRGLAAQAAEPEAWLSRVSNPQRTGYRDMAEDLYADLRDKGGIPIDLNLNQAIEPAERQVSNAVRIYRG